MLKKLQNNLVVRNPLIWNSRIIPALLITISINILFYAIGYFITYIDFNELYASPYSDNYLIYFGSVISGMLAFILWLISYSKNNALKAFYPKTHKAVYTEWLFIFIITLSMVSFPYSFQEGSRNKVKSYASKEDAISAIRTLNMVDILLPDSKKSYFAEFPDEGYNDNDLSMNNLKDEDRSYTAIDSIIDQADKEKREFEGHPNFTQLSLLNYTGYNYIYIPAKYNLKIWGSEKVKEWLIEKNKAEITKLMDAFLDLQNKHNLKSNLTRDKWLELIYNPDKYPIGDFNLISRQNVYDSRNFVANNDYSYKSRINNASQHNEYYVQYSELSSSYKAIFDTYTDTQEGDIFLISVVCVSLCLSLFVFGFRISSGKAWLIALVSMGLILIINTFLTLIVSISIDSSIIGPITYISVMLLIFIFELAYVIAKVTNRKPKRYSNIIVNHLIWYTPAVPFLIYILVYIISKSSCSYNEEACIYEFMETHSISFIWGNICLTFVTMWLFIRFVVLKWKSLPEG